MNAPMSKTVSCLVVGDFIDDAAATAADGSATTGPTSETVGSCIAGQFVDEAPDRSDSA